MPVLKLKPLNVASRALDRHITTAQLQTSAQVRLDCIQTQDLKSIFRCIRMQCIRDVPSMMITVFTEAETNGSSDVAILLR